MKILAIETSCDETAISLVEASGTLKTGPKFKVLEHLVSSQIAIHRPFGGVVPNLAKREHEKNLPILLRKLNVKGQLSDVNLVAVTVGPGLEPALWAGIEFAKKLAKQLKKPLVGANHLEGHIYSFLLPPAKKTANSKLETLNSKQIRSPKHLGFRNSNLVFPAISLLVSGGHTILLYVESLTKWKKIGETLDDAVGEAYDKVARLLELPYPGGPEIEKVARKGKPNIPFPRPMLNHKNFNFSFSGLKTAVLYYLRDNPLSTKNYKLKTDIAASFQEAAIDVLTKKTIRAAEEFGAKSVMLSGGVASNKALRSALAKASKKHGLKFIVPAFEYNTDNASMIAAAAYINTLKFKVQSSKLNKYKAIGKLKLEANGNLSL